MMGHGPELYGIGLVFIPVAAAFALLVWGIVRVLHKAGYSGWWVLLVFVPLVNLIMVWVFAFAEWPRGAVAPAAGSGA